MSAPQWMLDAVAASESLSLNDEGDRLTLLQRLVDARARCCRLCDQDLTGKTNRTHYAKVTDTTPCRGSFL